MYKRFPIRIYIYDPSVTRSNYHHVSDEDSTSKARCSPRIVELGSSGRNRRIREDGRCPFNGIGSPTRLSTSNHCAQECFAHLRRSMRPIMYNSGAPYAHPLKRECFELLVIYIRLLIMFIRCSAQIPTLRACLHPICHQS